MSYIGSTPTTQSFIAGTDYFNGTGSAVNFTLSRSVNSVNDIEVIVNNVEQIPSGYSVSGTTLTFSAAPSAGTSNVYVRYLSTTNLSLAIPAGTSAAFNTVTATTLGATNLAYTGTLTGGTGVVNLGSGQVYKDASGNVGIGLTNPHAVVGAKVGTFGANNNTAGCSFGVDSSGATQPIMGLRWTGANVGIAGSNFSSQLVSDSANALITEIYTTGATPLVFGTSSTERARIDSSGKLLVNTTVESSSNDSVVTIKGTGGQLTRCLALETFTTSSIIVQTFRNPNGQVGYITTDASSTQYNTSSDYRLKEAIAPMTGALAKVALLKPCTYKWKVDGSDGQGFIAHELAEVEAGCVTGEKDAVDADGNPQYQGIDTSFLVATLTAAIQEQQTTIVSLQDTLTALTAQTSALAERLTALEAK